ncbi:MAG: hypothetical protein PHU29_05210 [Sulfuricurvum sp.]|nr:hypothetical protein [Sulfuricurvum sp.]MDD5084405.1 hypothetical protein [Candidatus Moranbacteria bacterium]
MGKVLIAVGLIVAFLCWVTKREYDYIEQKSIDNGAESLQDKKKNIQVKLESHEKITKIERFHLLNWYAHKFVYGVLVYGIYGGFTVSLIGLILFLINK